MIDLETIAICLVPCVYSLLTVLLYIDQGLGRTNKLTTKLLISSTQASFTSILFSYQLTFFPTTQLSSKWLPSALSSSASAPSPALPTPHPLPMSLTSSLEARLLPPARTTTRTTRPPATFSSPPPTTVTQSTSPTPATSS